MYAIAWILQERQTHFTRMYTCSSSAASKEFCGPTDPYVKVEKLPWLIYHGKILREFSLGLANHGEILRDFCHDLAIVMGGFYVTCKVLPMFSTVSFIMGRFYVRSKFLRKIFPCNNHLPSAYTMIRGWFMCNLWPHVKSPHIDMVHR